MLGASEKKLRPAESGCGGASLWCLRCPLVATPGRVRPRARRFCRESEFGLRHTTVAAINEFGRTSRENGNRRADTARAAPIGCWGGAVDRCRHGDLLRLFMSTPEGDPKTQADVIISFTDWRERSIAVRRDFKLIASERKSPRRPWIVQRLRSAPLRAHPQCHKWCSDVFDSDRRDEEG